MTNKTPLRGTTFNPCCNNCWLPSYYCYLKQHLVTDNSSKLDVVPLVSDASDKEAILSTDSPSSASTRINVTAEEEEEEVSSM